MILDEETFKKFGYYSKDLKLKSAKKILVRCNECGKIRIISKYGYRDLCHPCSQKKRLENPLNNPMFGKHHTEKAKRKIGNAHRGKILSEVTKQKMSDVLEERYKNQENHPMYGKHHSKKTKQKMSDSQPSRCNELNPNWEGGISFEPYCIKFNDEFRERVRDYFGRCCYICGKNEIENGRKLDVHHVTYNKESCCDNSLPLFVPLCMNCHRKTSFNREYWQEFFEVSLHYLTNNKCYLIRENIDG